jgi:hypothetical protein
MRQAALGITVRSIDGEVITPAPSYISEIAKLIELSAQPPLIHRNDPWLRLPFVSGYYIENEVCNCRQSILQQSLEIIASWKPMLLKEKSY